ncbi:gamma-glutamylcyclotransferase family protein [Methylophaga sp. OBS4]|uniref:gamma-glutamylcyclotransferase family protein n=1 Tax=Methylophaga sp. OBS4 TaxID=2991935 RepID=UPI00225072B5|nr:gamma-glutamylcyclotransferase family protein [Methylophaga sp. OBS4]MCX4188248.1 gamma-glutamylcyclotransferase [Methylophaga sp. OBS4]
MIIRLSSTQTYLFVYGTLAQPSSHPMHALLKANSVFIAPAYMLGRLYEIRGYPGVVESEQQHEKVKGELYQLHRADWLLAKLDNYEECSAAFPQPHEYLRKQVEVFVSNTCSTQAWAYIYNHSTKHRKRIHSGDYFNR